MANTIKQQWSIPAIAFLFLLLAALACGGEAVEPEQVGQVSEDGEVSVTEEQGAETPEEQAADEQETVEETEVEEEAPAEEQEATVPQEGSQSDPYSLGDVVALGDMVLVLLGWEEVEGDSFNQPDEGQKFIAVDLMLVNRGDSATSVSSLLQMELRDQSAQRYTPDLMASVAVGISSPEGELSPGERIRGKVAFQVPEDVSALQFVFDADFLSSGRVFVALGDQPQSVEVPAELAGETPQEMYEIGEIVTLGDIVLVVLGWASPPGDEFSSPDPGMQFAVVDLILVNQGDTAQNVSSLLQVNLKDETDQLYNVDFMGALASGRSAPEGELAPGERIRGQIAFQVPQDAQELVFVFDADVFGEGKVFYSLPLEPTTIAPPDSIPGEREQEMAAVGETITLDDLALTVNEVTFPSGDDFNRPDEGNQFVIVDLTLQNQGSDVLNVSSLLQTWLKDATGQLYSLDISAIIASGGETPEGELGPGESIRGQVGFQVPVNSENLVFTFDRDVFSDGKAFVRLP